MDGVHYSGIRGKSSRDSNVESNGSRILEYLFQVFVNIRDILQAELVNQAFEEYYLLLDRGQAMRASENPARPQARSPETPARSNVQNFQTRCCGNHFQHGERIEEVKNCNVPR